jgi:sugar phosphate isomerase/epimerase
MKRLNEAGMDRRDALRGMAALALAPWATRGDVTTDERRRLNRIGLAVLTVNTVSAHDYEKTMHDVAAIGYREVDMYIYESRREPAETRAILDRAGLACTSARVASPALYRGWDRFLDAANTLGAKWITLAYLPYEERMHMVDWQELVDVLNKAGESARAHGLTFCYHSHDFELAPMEGKIPLDFMLASTDPSLVKLQMDVYWMAHGGRNPASEIRRLGSRVATLHLKDMDATPARGITTVGKGIIDFKAILAAAADTGVSNYYVEEDAPHDPMAAIRSSYDYLARLDF